MIGRTRLVIAGTAWATAAVLGLAPMGAGSAVAATGSAVTVSGAGPFASLKVTVSQTNDLIDQDVRVSWTGATATQNAFQADYLQIMQCWSDDPAGPSREQCEFGNSADGRAGGQVSSRQLDAGPSYVDVKEKQHTTPDNTYNQVPFESASWEDDPANPGHEIHPVVPGDHQHLGQFFDSQSTNELPLNATAADGTGEAYFETMTAEEAPGLGCGSTTTDEAGKDWAPFCWMVIVPRGETEVNGAPYTVSGSGLQSTPLSESNWENRIVVPLQFNPLAISCPIGGAERRTSGQEVAQEAVSRWQAELCSQSGTVYSYAKVSDDAARRQVTSASPGLGFITNPVPESAAGSSGVVYAPVAVSGAVIAFNIDYTLYGSEALKALAGQRVPQMNLTPRLVAKLLTQSYRLGTPAYDPATYSNAHNVLGLTYDPDFFAANPALTDLDSGVADVLVPFAPSDATQELWTWVNADPAARAFLDGTPDPWGMTVNPSYLHLTDGGVPNSFPKQDPYCQVRLPDNTGSLPANLCTLDDRPYANDMHDAARAASRGDTLARAQWDSTPPQPHYKKVPAQLSGSDSVMAFTDAATAARYSLPTARLENESGQFVGPTPAGLAAGLKAMTTDQTTGVLQPNPSASDPAAYPLTSITYAATSPSRLTPDQRAGYASFIQYGATVGQIPGPGIGQLPDGYLPMPADLATQAITASVQLRNYVAPAVSTSAAPVTTTSTAPTTSPPTTRASTPAPRPKPTSTPSAQPRPTHSVPPTATAPASVATTQPALVPAPPPPPAPRPAPPTRLPTSAPVKPPVATATAGPVPSSSAGSSEPTVSVAEVRRTPAVEAGDGRYVIVVLLAIGGVSALSGPALLNVASRRRR